MKNNFCCHRKIIIFFRMRERLSLVLHSFTWKCRSIWFNSWHKLMSYDCHLWPHIVLLAHAKRTNWPGIWRLFVCVFLFYIGDHMLRYGMEWHWKRWKLSVLIGWIGKPLLMLFDSIKNSNSRLDCMIVMSWWTCSALADDELRVVITRCIIKYEKLRWKFTKVTT